MRLSVRADSTHIPGKREGKYVTTLQEDGAGVLSIADERSEEKMRPPPHGPFSLGARPRFFLGPVQKEMGSFPALSHLQASVKRFPFHIRTVFDPKGSSADACQRRTLLLDQIFFFSSAE